MVTVFIQGFLLQASLILALGAQNIFVLNSGLRRKRHLLVAFVSSLCDSLLIFVGVLGVATIFVQIPLLKIALGVVGVTFLFVYGVLKLKEAKNSVEIERDSVVASSTKQVIFTSLGFSLLNPHVYLDTVVLVGGYSSQYTFLMERFYFGAGAASFSILWFYGLALLASSASRILNNQKAMRVIALLSGIILIVLAAKLGGDVWSWIKEFSERT